MAFWKSRSKYVALNDKDAEEGLLDQSNRVKRASNPTARMSTCSILTLASLLMLAIVPSWLVFFRSEQYQSSLERYVQYQQQVHSTTARQICEHPVVRKEWRTLSDAQKLDYISAVQCLATKPSILHRDASRYDDFPWVHKHLAPMTHVSAPFLPWHRAYIQVYEDALKRECGMQGNLPYWDWSLDWKDPASSPVWDTDLGLGGDGDVNGLESVGEGRCVINGPFAELQVKYFDDQHQPHCLSRGFASDLELRELGSLIQPSAIEHMMLESRYSSFEEDLEKRAHHFLSHSVRGDLSKFTGPNDPVFFLHHTNIDRIWWRWQQIDPDQRLYAYDGRASNVSDQKASLINVMDMAGLAENLRVVDVMETKRGQFCYTY